MAENCKLTYNKIYVSLAQFPLKIMSTEVLATEADLENEEPGSSTVVAAPGYARAAVTTLFVSRATGPTIEGRADSIGDDDENLSEADRSSLFSGLQTTLQRPENCEGVSDQWNAIERVLMTNPRMMRKLWRLQQCGAELVVTDFQEGEYVDFADAARNLNIQKQENALTTLSPREINDAITQILQPLPADQREEARSWILSRLRRSGGQRGLNYVDALVFAVAHGGTLISYEAYDAMARKDASVVENVTWTWYIRNLLKVIESGYAPCGFRYGGHAFQYEADAGYRYDDRGARVSGLRVQIS